MSNPAILVIAGTQSGVGKTTVATALAAACARRGLRVQPFKVGPDFIDPAFHRLASGRASRNLDGWMLSRAANLELFARAAADADVAIVEGMMGLYDGCDGRSDSGSTAEIAKWLRAPVLLVADASAMARSAAAVVRGFETLDPDVAVAAVLFNRVAGAGHWETLRDAVAAHCRALPLGFLPAEPSVSIPERHLGLAMPDESLDARGVARLADWFEAHVSVDRVLGVARPAQGAAVAPAAPAPRGRRTRIGIARDRAFCFYYADNLDLLERLGAELVEISPIADARLPPDLDGLYLGGGYPELAAAELAANASMRRDVAAFAASGAPVYAECGGFMYLTEAIVGADGVEHPMAGVFPTRARMRARLQAIGYVEIEITDGSGWAPAGLRARGHEFRYSAVDPMQCDVTRRYRASRGASRSAEGFVSAGVLASYVHLHFASCPELAARFVEACAARGSAARPLQHDLTKGH